MPTDDATVAEVADAILGAEHYPRLAGKLTRSDRRLIATTILARYRLTPREERSDDP
jgi:hypothetical protein